MDIYLKQALTSGRPRTRRSTYSQQVLDLTNGNTRDYLTNKIKKLSSAQSKTGVRQDAELASFLRDATADFIGATTPRWKMVHGLSKSDDAPSADAFVVLYEQDARYFGFLKVDHQAFTHYVNAEEGPLMNQLIIHQSILSNKTQKADEGFAINLRRLALNWWRRSTPSPVKRWPTYQRTWLKANQRHR